MTETCPVPDELKDRLFADLLQSDLMRDHRDQYVDIIIRNGVTHAENILRLNDWLTYM